MDNPVIHPQYVADLLDTMRRLDPEATEKILLIKVPVNNDLRQHPTIHFYDDKLTIFGALAGMTSTEAPYDNNKADPQPIIDFFNDLLEKDPEAIKGLVNERVSINWDLANNEDLTVIVDKDCDGNNINPRIGFLGVLNGLVGCEDDWGRIGVEMNFKGKISRFVYVPEYNKEDQ